MIRRICCFVATCDDCDDQLGNDNLGYTLHLDSDQEVLDHLVLTGWTVSEDGDIRCSVCTARNFCASLDHLWDVWRICECRGAIPAHADNGCGLYRTCTQCGAIDITDLGHLPTTGQHHRRGR
jgi:hypothetical protein